MLNPISHSLVGQDKCRLVEAPRPRQIPSAAPNCSYEGLVRLREKKLESGPIEGPKAEHLVWLNSKQGQFNSEQIEGVRR